MSILFFDTESSGLWRDNLEPDDPSQPHLVQLGAKLVDDKRRTVAAIGAIFKPDGWSIEPEAEKVHGISEIRAHKFGVAPVPFLAAFKELAGRARLIVAHHANFDRRMVRLAVRRAGGNAVWFDNLAKSIHCTMEESTDICRLPNPKMGGFKFPSLSEAHDFFFPERAPYETRHDAIVDLGACEAIYYAIQGAKNGTGTEGGFHPNANRSDALRT